MLEKPSASISFTGPTLTQGNLTVGKQDAIDEETIMQVADICNANSCPLASCVGQLSVQLFEYKLKRVRCLDMTIYAWPANFTLANPTTPDRRQLLEKSLLRAEEMAAWCEEYKNRDTKFLNDWNGWYKGAVFPKPCQPLGRWFSSKRRVCRARTLIFAAINREKDFYCDRKNWNEM